LEPLRGKLGRDAFYRLALVVSELVANGLQHGGPEGVIRLEVVEGDEVVKVRVGSPRGETEPRLVDPGYREDGSGGGLGLHLVERLGAAWGVDCEAAETLVWADVAVDEAADVRRRLTE
jgi:anti-sigma regulatory factor (Ser/Thr protein kinase)